MNNNAGFNYKTEANRYTFYYQRIQRFYQKPVTQVSVAVLFTIFTILFFAVFAIKPTLDTVSELLKKIEDQKEILRKAEQKAAALGSAQQQLDQMMQYQTALDAAIPASSKIQDLIHQLEWLASTNAISLNSLRISDIQYPEVADEGIHEVQFSMSFSATYQTARSFLQGITTLPRFISVDRVSFDVDTTKAVEKNSLLQVSFRCRAFINTIAK